MNTERQKFDKGFILISVFSVFIYLLIGGI